MRYVPLMVYPRLRRLPCLIQPNTYYQTPAISPRNASLNTWRYTLPENAEAVMSLGPIIVRAPGGRLRTEDNSKGLSGRSRLLPPIPLRLT